jgi:hypothetical protein
MGTKSQFRSVSLTSGIRYYNKFSGALESDGFYPHQATWTDTVTHGDSLPDWRQALKEGRDASTSLSGSRSQVGVISANLKFISNFFNSYILVQGAHFCNVAPPAGDPDALSSANTEALALGKFAQKVNQIEGTLQGGVVLGELRQTLQMLRSPAQGLRRLVDDQRGILARIRAQRRLGSIILHKRKIAENLADAWLELQYGWRPFLSDVKAACEALDIYTTGQSVVTRRVTAVETTNEIGTRSVSTQGESIALVDTYSQSNNHIQVIFRGALRVEAHHPGSMDARLLGFRPKDFLPTAWELIPYSFLVDYFSNIGGIIYGMSNLGTRLSWCNRTTRRSIEALRGTLPHPQGGVTVTGNYARIIAVKTTIQRVKYTGHGVPPLAFRIPSFRSLKWLNIAALVASRKSDRTWSFD